MKTISTDKKHEARVKLTAIVLVTGMLAAVTGCAVTTESKTGPGQVLAKPVDLPDGGEVLCVFWVPVDVSGAASAEGAQMDCDWAGKKAAR